MVGTLLVVEPQNVEQGISNDEGRLRVADVGAMVRGTAVASDRRTPPSARGLRTSLLGILSSAFGHPPSPFRSRPPPPAGRVHRR